MILYYDSLSFSPGYPGGPMGPGIPDGFGPIIKQHAWCELMFVHLKRLIFQASKIPIFSKQNRSM